MQKDDAIRDSSSAAAPPPPAEGRRYRVRVIGAGLSINGNFYTDTVLRQSAALFEGARVFVKSDRDHLTGGGKDVRNLIGRMVNAAFVAGRTPDSGEIVAELELIEPDGAIGRKLRQAHTRGMSDLFGLSIDSEGATRATTINGKPAKLVTALTKVRSVDLIVEPSAGGRVVDLLEAAPVSPIRETQIMDREEIIAALREADASLLAGKDVDRLSDRELTALLREGLANGRGRRERIDAMRARIGRVNLGERAKRRLIEAVESGRIADDAGLSREIGEELAEAARHDTGGRVTGCGDRPVIELIEGRDEKTAKMLDALLDPRDNSATSIRECYRDMTGDRRFTGMIRECDRSLLREALGSQSFGEALGDALHRRMIREYNAPDVMDVWKDMVDIVPVTDFRDQNAVRYGGYGDLPKVEERQPYNELTSPTDEKASYAVEKRGGMESVSLEMIRNDDMRVIGKLPGKLATAAKRTLSRFVLSIPAANPQIYDGKALFHADHGNLGAAALASASVAAGRLAMKNQKEKDSEEKLALIAKFLWVPDDLEEAAFNLFRRDVNQDADFIQSLMLQVRPVWCWNDAADWMLTCDPTQAPFIELAFLDGHQEPELFIQDSPTMGSMFANDTVTYKVRHIYGAAPVDFRTAYKSVVP